MQYYYDADGNLYQIRDGLASMRTTYEFDLAGRIIGSASSSLDGADPYGYISTRYEDGTGNVDSQSAFIFNEDGSIAKNVDYNYTYYGVGTGKDPEALVRYSVDGTVYEYVYDDLGRLVTRKSTVGASADLPTTQQLLSGKTESYTYVTSGDNTTTLVKTYRDINGELHSYTYDKNGNIICEEIGEEGATGNKFKTYLYDAQNRLTRYNDSELDLTILYNYDARGNITSYTTYEYSAYTNDVNTCTAYTYTYSYGNGVFKDVLTAYKGEAISYDGSFNPLTWGLNTTLTWTQGRRLAKLYKGVKVYSLYLR